MTMRTMQLTEARAALLGPAARRWGVCSLSKASRGRETGRFHDRIMQSQRMKDALAELERAAPGSRVDFFMKVRDAYRQVAAEEFAKFKKPREERPATPEQPPK